MSTSAAKVLANRINGSKSKGPKDTTRTRFNARTHGLRSAGITELDDPELYNSYVSDLHEQYGPQGCYDHFLVHSAAFHMVRCIRARRLEAEQITARLHPPKYEKDPLAELTELTCGRLVDPGRPATLAGIGVEADYARYETSSLNKVFKVIHELERSQRMKGRASTSQGSDRNVCQRPEGPNSQGSYRDPALSQHPGTLPNSEELSPEATEGVPIPSAGVVDPETRESEKRRVPEPKSARPRTDAVINTAEVFAAKTDSWFPPSRPGPLWKK